MGIQGPMWHEGVEKTEVWAVTAVAKDRQEALVREAGERGRAVYSERVLQ